MKTLLLKNPLFNCEVFTSAIPITPHPTPYTLFKMRKSLTRFEYAPNWPTTCRRVYKLQRRCTNNPFHGRATVVHHLKYRRSLLRRILGMFLLHYPGVSVSGFEIPGWDCVGVCKTCHNNYYGRSGVSTSVHHPNVWIQKGGLNNRQTCTKAMELRVKFWLLTLMP